jgi:CHAT domain-containing protein
VSYLSDKFIITYSQSATSLHLTRTLKKEKRISNKVLAVVDPIFSPNDNRAKGLLYAKNEELIKKLNSGMIKMGVKGIKKKGEVIENENEEGGEEKVEFERLQKTSLIVDNVKELFGQRAIVLTGESASEEVIRNLSFDKYKYIVFGTHGILDKQFLIDQEPALVLNQVGNREPYDGFLTMSEVMGLKIPADTVVLTACQTGIGEKVSGEGVMGMGRAFQYAGAGNVLMSLWSVDESAAVELTKSFLSYLKDGHNAKEALSLARKEIRNNGYEHPFYWSAFILVGK